MAETATIAARGGDVDASAAKNASGGGHEAAEVEMEAELASLPADAKKAAPAEAMPFDDDGPAWPSDADEAAFLGEEKEQGRAAPRAGAQTLRQAATEAEAALGPLPSLNTLIERIPPETREALDDLFRVKFTAVRRVRADVLK